MARERDLQGRDEVGRGERLDDIGHGTGVTGTFDELLLREGGEQHDRGDAGAGDALGRGDPVEDGHLDVHDDEIGAQLLGQADGGFAVRGFTDDVVADLAEHFYDIETDHGLVFGHDYAADRHGLICS